MVEFIVHQLDLDEDSISKIVAKRHDEQGIGGLYELARELTDEFESIHKGKNWDGNYFDEIEIFLNNKKQIESNLQTIRNNWRLDSI